MSTPRFRRMSPPMVHPPEHAAASILSISRLARGRNGTTFSATSEGERYVPPRVPRHSLHMLQPGLRRPSAVCSSAF